MHLPEKIANAPRLQLGLDLYFDAFFDLSTCRPIGMGMGPIPWSVIRDYAETFRLSEEQTDDLSYYVRVLDVEYMKHQAPKKGGKPAWEGQKASASSQGAWPSKRKA